LAREYNIYISKNISKIVVIVLIVSNILCAALLYNQLIITNEYIKKIEEYENNMNKLTKLQEEEIEKQCVTYYEKHLTKLLDEYELTFLAQKQWNYALSLNGEIVDKSIIYIDDDYVHLILAEIVEEEDILPSQILKKGTISGDDPNDMLQDHINISTNIDYSINVDKNGYDTKVIYDFKNIPKGTLINIKLSPLLSECLQVGKGPHWENRIEIIRK